MSKKIEKKNTKIVQNSEISNFRKMITSFAKKKTKKLSRTEKDLVDYVNKFALLRKYQ